MVLLYCSTKVLYCPLLQKISLIWEVFVQVYDLLSSEDFKNLKDKIKKAVQSNDRTAFYVCF